MLNRFPSTGFNRINLDWIMRKLKQVSDVTDNIGTAVEDAQQAAAEATTAAAGAVAAAGDATQAAEEATAALSGIEDDVAAALQTANGAQSTAATAQSTAAAAQSTATAAQSAAAAAQSAADNAQSTADDAQSAINDVNATLLPPLSSNSVPYGTITTAGGSFTATRPGWVIGTILSTDQYGRSAQVLVNGHIVASIGTTSGSPVPVQTTICIPVWSGSVITTRAGIGTYELSIL